MTARAARGWVGRAVGAGLGLALLPLALSAQEIRYTGSLGFSQGRYIFTDRTESVSLLTGLSARWDRVGLSASVPVIAQNSSALSYVHGVLIPTGGPEGGAVRQREPGHTVPMGPHGGPHRQGVPTAAATADSVVSAPGDYEVHLGDPVVSATVEGFRGTGVLRSVELKGSVKAPVASVESGVGTGAWDWGLGGAVTLGAGQALFFADATYWSLGDLPDLELKGYVDAGAGAGLRLGERWSVLGSVAAGTEIIENVDPPVSVSLSASRRASRGRSVHAGVGVGLTESAADLSLFVGWGMALREGR